jgi:hypothetical protein
VTAVLTFITVVCIYISIDTCNYIKLYALWKIRITVTAVVSVAIGTGHCRHKYGVARYAMDFGMKSKQLGKVSGYVW